MQSLLPLAEKIAARLIERHETIAVTESSTGGLIAAALLSVPGASAYFLGGAVAYTKAARWRCSASATPRWPTCGPRPKPIRC